MSRYYNSLDFVVVTIIITFSWLLLSNKQTNKQKIQKSSYHQFFVRLFLHEKAGLAEIEYVPNKTIIIKTKHTSDNEKPTNVENRWHRKFSV